MISIFHPILLLKEKLLNLNNYVTQKEFKNLTGNVDTSDK